MPKKFHPSSSRGANNNNRGTWHRNSLLETPLGPTLSGAGATPSLIPIRRVLTLSVGAVSRNRRQLDARNEAASGLSQPALRLLGFENVGGGAGSHQSPTGQ